MRTTAFEAWHKLQTLTDISEESRIRLWNILVDSPSGSEIENLAITVIDKLYEDIDTSSETSGKI